MFSEYEETILDFIANLSTSNPDDFTAEDWKLIKFYTKSDGCTHVANIFVPACWEHDFYFRTHHDFEGKVITFAEANCRYRHRMQKLSGLGKFDPISWWRWAGVSLLGKQFWDDRVKFHG